jgi:hypothetical protein
LQSSAIFHIELLKHYQVLDRPGTFIVSVAYDVTEANLYVGDNYPRYLVPLRVIRSEDLPELVKILKSGNTPFYRVKHLFLTGAIFDNGEIDILALPAKGEQVVATFEVKDEKLLCTHIKLIDRDDLLHVNFSAIDDLYCLAEEYLSKKL